MSKSMKSITGLILSAAIAATLSLCAVGNAAAQTVTLRYGQAFSALRSIFALPLLVAEREKFFAREGLNFVVVPITGGGEKLIEALHDDTADMTHVATAFMIQAAMKGSDAVAIAAEFNNPIYSLIAKPEIKTYADLKGKLLGFAAETGSSQEIARAVTALYFEPDRGAMPRQAEIDLKGLAQVIDFMGEAGTLKAPLPPTERFVDLQYLRAAGIE